MILMLDNNIILDHVGQREPFYRLSRLACLLGITGEAETYISVNMLTDLFYLLRKDYGSGGAQDMLANSLSFLKLVGVSAADAQAALALRWNDFEDALVAQCAKKIGADYIVTRNVKDFRESSVRAVTPEELFEILRKRGIEYEELGW